MSEYSLHTQKRPRSPPHCTCICFGLLSLFISLVSKGSHKRCSVLLGVGVEGLELPEKLTLTRWEREEIESCWVWSGSSIYYQQFGRSPISVNLQATWRQSGFESVPVLFPLVSIQDIVGISKYWLDEHNCGRKTVLPPDTQKASSISVL